MANPRSSHTQPAQITAHLFADDGAIPNNPRLPFLVYQGALRLSAPRGRPDPAAVAETVFAANGWGGLWRNSIFPFPHYHSTAHEVLAVCRGWARVRFGGAQGVTQTVNAGDVAVIPAGVGHENLGDSGDLLVVGAYPPGQQPDLCYGEPDERPRVLKNIAQIPLPPTDPVYGQQGPLISQWNVAASSQSAG
jgi:uncharacterized protein YjlB